MQRVMLRLLIGHLRELWSRRSVTAAAEFVDPRRTRLAQLERDAERAIEDMYDAAFGSAATARYSDAKEFLHDAIAAARELGDAPAAERLSKRLAEVKSVFRTQFSI